MLCVDISNEGLEQLKIILEDWIPKNASIAVASEDSYIYYSPSIEHLHLTIEDKIHPESVASHVLQT